MPHDGFLGQKYEVHFRNNMDLLVIVRDSAEQVSEVKKP